VAAREDVRRRQALRAQDRAVGAAADRLADDLEALGADRLLSLRHRLREGVDVLAHVRVLRRDRDLDARAGVAGGDLLGGLLEQRRVGVELGVVEVARDRAQLHPAGGAEELIDVDEAVAAFRALRGELGRERGGDLARDPGRVDQLVLRPAGVGVDAVDRDDDLLAAERLVLQLAQV